MVTQMAPIAESTSPPVNGCAMAILDRLAMNAIRLDINGPSYRQHLADLRAQKQPVANGQPAAG
jgi:hypothetical protein